MNRRTAHNHNPGIRGIQRLAGLALLAICAMTQAKGEKDQASLEDALRQGSASIGLRYRLEQVELSGASNPDTGYDNSATASTLRTTLGFRSGRWQGFSAYIQFENVSNLGAADLHNSTTNGVTDRPVIADPKGTEVQQAYLRYSLDDRAEFTLGRLEFALNNQRFVGPVGWRQNHQSFDLLKADLHLIPRTRLSYAYLDRVHRVFGYSVDMSSHLLNAPITLGNGTLTPYFYLLDYAKDSGFREQSSRTLGLSWSHAFNLTDDWSMPYRLEFADQRDAGGNPNERDADYLNLELGFAGNQFWIKGGLEQLSGSPGDGQFSTPLATLHAFNGWADLFLSTPAGGLQDSYLAAGLSWGGRWSGQLKVHRFNADTTFLDPAGYRVDHYGNEVDALLTYTAAWKQQFAIKIASYSAADDSVLGTGTDTMKYWFYSTYSW